MIVPLITLAPHYDRYIAEYFSLQWRETKKPLIINFELLKPFKCFDLDRKNRS